MSMCWCKDCKWLYKGKCSCGQSDNCTDKVGGYNSCKYSQGKVKDCDYCKGILDATKASPRRNYIYCPMCGVKRERESSNE